MWNSYWINSFYSSENIWNNNSNILLRLSFVKYSFFKIEQFSKAIHLNFGKPVDDEVAKAEENQIINSFSEQERKELEEMGKFLKNIFDEETVKKLDEIETIEKTLQQQKRQNE